LEDVVIFATFAYSGSASLPNTLPNQGLGRKIARKLSSYYSPLNHSMTIQLMAKSKVAMATLAALTALSSVFIATPAFAQTRTVTAAQKDTANQVAQKGVPLADLAANAPDSYTILGGDTLWGISKLFLKSPWRWPELWGMNLTDIKNPHLIYPGQRLVLERKNGLATLRVEGADSPDGSPMETVRVSPRTRYESLASSALTTLRSSLIEPFLAEPMIATEAEFLSAARIVSAQESRVLLTRGDRAYARGQNGTLLLDDQAREKQYRVFRTATPLKDPVTAEVLGYEAMYVGKAKLVQGETTAEVTEKDGKLSTAIVPASIDIVSAKEEMRVGDRMLPEPPKQLLTYTPRMPEGKVDGRIVSVYGSAVVNAAQNQVVTINRGTRDGVQVGYVMAILKDGARVLDKSDATHPLLKLPDERNGLLMVFRTFDRLSYALILEITDGVRVGDRLTSPRP
jgi:nucleoid-associated protein YgaU